MSVSANLQNSVKNLCKKAKKTWKIVLICGLEKIAEEKPNHLALSTLFTFEATGLVVDCKISYNFYETFKSRK